MRAPKLCRACGQTHCHLSSQCLLPAKHRQYRATAGLVSSENSDPFHPEILSHPAIAGRDRTLSVPPVGKPVGRREEDVRNVKASRSRDSAEGWSRPDRSGPFGGLSTSTDPPGEPVISTWKRPCQQIQNGSEFPELVAQNFRNPQGSGKIWRQRSKVTWTHSPLIAEVGSTSQDFRHRIGQRLKSSRSRYVPVSRNFAVFCVFDVSRNQ